MLITKCLSLPATTVRISRSLFGAQPVFALESHSTRIYHCWGRQNATVLRLYAIAKHRADSTPALRRQHGQLLNIATLSPLKGAADVIPRPTLHWVLLSLQNPEGAFKATYITGSLPFLSLLALLDRGRKVRQGKQPPPELQG